MLAFLDISDLYGVFLLRQHLHIVISKHFTTIGSDSEKRKEPKQDVINGIVR